jgi:hypothetical protein
MTLNLVGWIHFVCVGKEINLIEGGN